MSVTIHLPQFDGPLPLLLYLIRKEEMDILDININEITRQYLDYIRMMRELDLEMAGEFVAMAATLIHIKSMMLLPNYNPAGEPDEHHDPRKVLVQRLLEYQKFQEAAQKLGGRIMLGRDTWVRGMREDWSQQEEEVIVVEDSGLFSLISTFRQMLRQVTKKSHRVAGKLQSIASRVLEIRHFFKVGERVIFRDLITAQLDRPAQVLVTLLSLLELGRLGFVSLFQAEPCGDIYIEAKQHVEHDIITRVKDFEIENREELKQALFTGTPAAVTEASAMEAPGESEQGEPAGDPLVAESTGVADEFTSATDDELLAAEMELGLEPLEIEPSAAPTAPVAQDMGDVQNAGGVNVAETDEADEADELDQADSGESAASLASQSKTKSVNEYLNEAFLLTNFTEGDTEGDISAG